MFRRQPLLFSPLLRHYLRHIISLILIDISILLRHYALIFIATPITTPPPLCDVFAG
jgi:hypothetical protein